jgi:isochorismate hydrolase
MILVSDVVAEVSREEHKVELQTMDRLFADVKRTNDDIAWVAGF